MYKLSIAIFLIVVLLVKCEISQHWQPVLGGISINFNPHVTESMRFNLSTLPDYHYHVQCCSNGRGNFIGCFKGFRPVCDCNIPHGTTCDCKCVPLN